MVGRKQRDRNEELEEVRKRRSEDSIAGEEVKNMGGERRGRREIESNERSEKKRGRRKDERRDRRGGI